ncbi:30S ribosomal protein S12 methylthiotransferase accessory factor YcaO [Candidatus Thiothrix sp. Deng01]|uniref:30S ribosomal protein S12 methylthiotransferase accessory factor YcaO n=1 Tax=Candidatus Thiothrix phosphatis TaxID=3112415 RepID=A0ABU6D1D3_9GAMM|nr:30S ribosomal protein S12 methylthiotransferase accessory factor YcaO [Candidatus Thiothrix sp. Deng01]MEB4592189.1 30S ribosomal protein S12 methylthiotransferase accessory factor YcaO [Candidatus Thiothrix sp. Deng01]
MQEQTFIPGKDAALEISIASMQEKLLNLGFHIEEASWLNPVANVWSVHIRDRDCHLLFTNGKGASQKAALASALGEFFERLSTNYFWADFYLGETIANSNFVHYPEEKWFPLNSDGSLPEGLLDEDSLAFYDPDSTLDAAKLVDLNSGNEERGICALPYVRQSDGETVWFPVNVIGNLYVSNGMSAGNTKTEARTQALSEIFERHIKFRIIAEGICLPDVPEEVIARYPHIQAGIGELRAAGFGILVKDASLGGQYPVMCVTLLNPEDQGLYASFGAHPRFEVALERSLTELLQGRALDRLAGFSEPSFDLEDVASPQNLETHFIDSSSPVHWDFLWGEPDYAFADWNFSGDTEAECQYLMDRIHAEDYAIYIMDYEHLGVYACRIIVPEMSEIYQTDDLEWDNNSAGNAVREAILQLPELDDEECAELFDAIEDMGLDEHQPITALIGLAPDPGTLWADLRVGELKTLLALVMHDEDAIREGCQWMRHFEQISPDHRRVYRCIETLLDMEDAEGYAPNLETLYSAPTLQQAQNLLDGSLRFWGITAPTLELKGCDMHQRLLAAYRKTHPTLQA